MDQSHCVTGEARWRPQEPGPGEPHMGTRATIQVRSSWHHSLKVQVRRSRQQDSPIPGEAQVATSHHNQVRTS